MGRIPEATSGVLLRTLGCRLNQAESDEIRDAFAARGVRSVGSADRPEVVVVNTCTVTAEASKASRKLIRAAVRDYPGARVVVTGCYAVAEPQVVSAITGVDRVVPNKDKETLAAEVADAMSSPRNGRPVLATVPGPRANLKVQTGCDERCTFCIVPRTRGGLESRPARQVLAAADAYVARGVREIVLTGVHLGKYGADRGERGALTSLLEQLCAIPGLERVRLSSIEASQVDNDLLRVLAAEPKMCRHLHLPLQTGDPDVWRAMRRPGTLGHYLSIAARARELIPEVSLTTDVMVGYPREDEAAFRRTLRVVALVGFQKLHVFRFSARPGTTAARLEVRGSEEVCRDRSRRVRELGDHLRRAWLRGHEGRRVRVLVEEAGRARGAHPRRPRLSGFTDNYLRVHTSGSAGLVGSLLEVAVTSSGHDSVEGDIVDGLRVLQDRGGLASD